MMYFSEEEQYMKSYITFWNRTQYVLRSFFFPYKSMYCPLGSDLMGENMN